MQLDNISTYGYKSIYESSGQQRKCVSCHRPSLAPARAGTRQSPRMGRLRSGGPVQSFPIDIVQSPAHPAQRRSDCVRAARTQSHLQDVARCVGTGPGVDRQSPDISQAGTAACSEGSTVIRIAGANDRVRCVMVWHIYRFMAINRYVLRHNRGSGKDHDSSSLQQAYNGLKIELAPQLKRPVAAMKIPGAFTAAGSYVLLHFPIPRTINQG